MLENYLTFGAFGVGIGAGIISYFFGERRLIKKNKEACNDLITKIDKIKKKEEISKLVICLSNYLVLRTSKENYY